MSMKVHGFVNELMSMHFADFARLQLGVYRGKRQNLIETKLSKIFYKINKDMFITKVISVCDSWMALFCC